MKTYQQWMQEYAVDHTHPTNQAIHKVCVPLIMFSFMGLIWSLPTLRLFSFSINWTFVILIPVLIFYGSLKNWPSFFLMVFQLNIMLFVCSILDESGDLVWLSLVIFILAWIGQFIGHKIEGRKPSFLQDLSFLLIGPLWVNQGLLKLLGIPSSCD